MEQGGKELERKYYGQSDDVMMRWLAGGRSEMWKEIVFLHTIEHLVQPIEISRKLEKDHETI